MLKRKYRVSPKEDFEKIYKKGKKIRGEFGMLVFWEDKSFVGCQFGIIVGKKIGKANQRNKLKRRVRSIINKLLREGFFEGKKCKITYIAFKKPENFVDLEKETLEQFKKLF